MTRHSHQDAVDESTFEHLVSVADGLPAPYDAECTLVLYAAGRLGMRAGEISHLSEEWVDWERSLIEIPKHMACESGIHGGPCGYCKQQARQAAGNHEELSYEEALEQRWSPKTPSVRSSCTQLAGCVSYPRAFRIARAAGVLTPTHYIQSLIDTGCSNMTPHSNH